MGSSPAKAAPTVLPTLLQEVPLGAEALPEWSGEAAKAAQDLLRRAALDPAGPLTPTRLAEAWQVLESREPCRHHDCRSLTCRFRHDGDDLPLWTPTAAARLDSPGAYGQEARKLRLANCEWALMGRVHAALGDKGFCLACRRQAAALEHFATREGARFVLRGLPLPDQVQAFAIRRVQQIWGDQAVNRAVCQEYLDRSAARTKSTIHGGDYSAPGRSPVSGHWGGPQGTVNIARIVKVGINNPEANLSRGAARDTAWHGCQARSLHEWAKDGQQWPKFRIDKCIHTAHRPGVYVSPSFEQAVLYAFRRWDKQPRFDKFTTSTGERWNYLTVMQLAIYDRGRPGAVDECARTWPAAATDGWDAGKLEWVVRDASKAQIYGILFCFFPDDPHQGD